jgi:polysaccharide export outer membrane protein
LVITADADKADTTGFEIFDVDAKTAQILHGSLNPGLAATFGSAPPPARQVVRPGDELAISVWEAATGGLFGANVNTTGAPVSTLPGQIVGSDGTITIPFGGEIHAAGLAPEQLAGTIKQRLTGKAIDPQVLVTIVKSAGDSATVIGDVTGAGRVQLSPKGDRLLEVIAQAGGVRAAQQQTFIRVTRGQRTSAVLVGAILERPSENIYVHPGDLIYVYMEPQTFTALGAVTHSGELPIDRMEFTLAEALGGAGGLNDAIADTGGVFLFRFESADVVRKLRPTSALLSGNSSVPVIYSLSFLGAQGFFLAKLITIHSRDVIYVADSPATELVKFLSVVRGVAGTVRVIGSSTVSVQDN